MERRAEGELIVLRTDPGQHHLERLAQAFPALHIVLATTPEAWAEVQPEATGIIGGSGPSAEELAATPQLRWIQATSAGVEEYLIPELAERSIVLTNFSGVAARNIAEHVLALILAFARGLKPLLDLQHNRQWGSAGPALVTFELTDQIVGVVGMGDIGDELAQRAHALGMRVIATQRHPPAKPPPYVERVLPSDRLDELLATADHVVLCLPLTDQTRHTIGSAELARMRRTAYLYNVGRGELIDQTALLEALQTGEIAGAGLDVTTPEPLPPDSPLWDLSNTIITGHTAGDSPHYWQRGIELVIENIGHFLAGEPLTNVVDTRRGY
jgi:phosphoglycerate dehydrogenase-like enzyme